MPKIFDVSFPDNLGNNQEEVISVLCSIAMQCAWHNREHAFFTFGEEYVLDRSPLDGVLSFFQFNNEQRWRQPKLLAKVQLKSTGEWKKQTTLEYLVKPEDPALIERILREAIIACLGDSRPEADLLRPVYPEPACYRLIQEEGKLPKRLVTQEWQRWYHVNGYTKPMVEMAFQKILAAEFAEADHAKKEWGHKPTDMHGEFEIIIYHVERTRV